MAGGIATRVEESRCPKKEPPKKADKRSLKYAWGPTLVPASRVLLKYLIWPSQELRRSTGLWITQSSYWVQSKYPCTQPNNKTHQRTFREIVPLFSEDFMYALFSPPQEIAPKPHKQTFATHPVPGQSPKFCLCLCVSLSLIVETQFGQIWPNDSARKRLAGAFYQFTSHDTIRPSSISQNIPHNENSVTKMIEIRDFPVNSPRLVWCNP